MSTPRPATPAKLMVSILYREVRFRDQALTRLTERFGPVDFQSPELDFTHTTYYEREMGPGIRRILASFAPLVPRETLADTKLATNAIEQILADAGGNRRVNIDPGLVTVENLVLATGKNFSHRIYLGQGIYAEVTLIYRKGGFEALPWTYPDYAGADIQRILVEMRRRLLDALRHQRAGDATERSS